MAHLKRKRVPKSWPIHRKGSTYIIRPASGIGNGVPLLVLLRDMLGICANRKEVKRALHLKQINVNGKLPKSEKSTIALFDKISIPESKKYYRLTLKENGKYGVVPIPAKDAETKVAKITGKKILKGKKVQINLSDGRNFLTNDSCKVNDSAIINFKDKKIEKCLPLKEKAKVIVIGGKHFGKRGLIEKIKEDRGMVSVKANGEKINVLIKQVMVNQ